MAIVARARAFVESLRAIARRTELERRRCPSCGSTHVHRHGTYLRYPYTLQGRRTVVMQRYRCQDCRLTYTPEHPDLPPGARYARSVRRCAIDQYLHTRSSLRRVAEWLRSEIGHQERWAIWHPLGALWEPPEERARCTLGASTLCLWLDQAGERAERGLAGLYEGVEDSGRVGVDGLWARLRHGAVRVLLMVRDSVTGLLYPPVVAAGEEAAEAWGQLLTEAARAGLRLEALRALVSDGAQGLVRCIQRATCAGSCRGCTSSAASGGMICIPPHLAQPGGRVGPPGGAGRPGAGGGGGPGGAHEGARGADAAGARGAGRPDVRGGGGGVSAPAGPPAGGGAVGGAQRALPGAVRPPAAGAGRGRAGESRVDVARLPATPESGAQSRQ